MISSGAKPHKLDDAKPLITILPDLSPEYTPVYSGFFLDGILTVSIRQTSKEDTGKFFFLLELLDNECMDGIVSVPEKILNSSSIPSVVNRVLEEIENVYYISLLKESKHCAKH